MSEFKGTPGPWAIEAGFLVTRAHCGGVGIPMFELDGHCECGDRINPVTGTDEQAAADMRLIAAAPELLAEVRQCALELDEAANVFEATMPGLARIYRLAATRAYAVVAKATGSEAA